jgi:hypothetical protein
VLSHIGIIRDYPIPEADQQVRAIRKIAVIGERQLVEMVATIIIPVIITAIHV